ncbi:hypothetical protein SLEP1_g18157 [Rubroshorea leprosula]|uniref:Reverse transcriptase domain-containing protein n=1 Tax=Rubroshorea leprosula TaxID=152421 RepID=A0AAV5IWN4_9ROSI|nr:hypothetical protein SLEP1_g18157 [Rubroshorea leprosula]
MDVFTPDGLGYISSAIGVPLALDKATEDRTCVDFAKVFVEIDVATTNDLHDTIPVSVDDIFSKDVKEHANDPSPKLHGDSVQQSTSQPLSKGQNSFVALESIEDEKAFPPLHSILSKSPRKPRQASMGVIAATKALAPRQRQSKKVGNSSSEGCFMYQLCKKLKALKVPLRQLNRDCYSDIHTKVQQESKNLRALQVDLLSNPHEDLALMKQQQAKLVIDLVSAEEAYLKQKSRVNWLKVGGDGARLSQLVEIAKEAVSFYRRLLGTEDATCNGGDLNELKGILDFQLREHVRNAPIQPITTDECKSVFFHSPNNKSLGPDGFTAEFFKEARPIIGDLVIKAIQEFFTSGKLKKCLPLFVSNNRCAFIEGRLMVENVLLAQEVVRNYHRSNLSPRCALKIDLMKAFDLVSWDFLFKVLEALAYPSVFISWIKTCVTTPMFSVSINGNMEGYFLGKKGIRQGDPLSPYLFVICIAVLSRLLNKAAQEGSLPYHPKCNKVGLTHLCFMDDLLIFTHGSREAVAIIDSILQKFYTISGLKVNYQKFELFCCRISNSTIQCLIESYGFKLGILPVRYLGVPLITERLTDADLKPLITKITARIQSWSSKYLSFAGRLQLITSVFEGIANF